MTQEQYKFKGYDWTEVGEALGLSIPELQDYAVDYKTDNPERMFNYEYQYLLRIREKLTLTQENLDLCIKFLDVLIPEHEEHIDHPDHLKLFKEIRACLNSPEVEEQKKGLETFKKFLPCMWT